MNKCQCLLLFAWSIVLTCALVCASPAAMAQATIASGTWSSIGPVNMAPEDPFDDGPGDVAGQVNGVAVDPNNANVIYVAATSGGVWKSTDSGTTWSALSNSAPWTNQAVNTVVVNPSNSEEIWVGTGNYLGSNPSAGTGLMRSENGGSSWNNVGAAQFGTDDVSCILVDPHFPSIVTIGTYGGDVWQSTNSGASWTEVIPVAANWQGIITTDSGYFAVGVTAGGAGVLYSSTNSGASWSAVAASPLAATGESGEAIASSNVTGNIYLASVGDGKIFQSADGGNTWTDINKGAVTWFGTGVHALALAVQPTVMGANNTSVDAIYVGSIDLWVSINDGANWTDLSAGNAGVDQHGVSFIASTYNEAVISNDEGVYLLNYDINGTKPAQTSSFASLNADLSIAAVNHAAYSTTDSDIVLASLGGGQYTLGMAAVPSSSLGAWTGVAGGADGVISSANDAVQFTTEDNSGFFEIDVSSTDNDWVTSNFISLNVFTDDVPQAPVLAYDATNNLLYTATNYLYQYNVTAGTWSQRLGGQELTASNDTVDAVTIAPSDPNTIYTASQTGEVWMTTNQGANWEQINSGAESLPSGTPVTSISVNPTDADDVLVSCQGTTTGHVYQCTNTLAGNAVTWTNISSNLPDAGANSIVRDIDNPTSTFYVGTDIGVYFTTDGGSSWQNATQPLGLPIVPVSDMAAVSATRTLYAATLGRGIYSIAFPAPTPTISLVNPDTAAIGTKNFQITVTGTGFFTGSVIDFDNTPIQTTYNSSTSLTGSVSGTLLTQAGSVPVTVVNPAPGGASAPYAFTITNAVPTITSLSPSSALVGSPALTLTVNGTGFYTTSANGAAYVGSEVFWGGTELSTSFVSTTEIQAAIPATDLAVLATVPITVENAGPTSSSPIVSAPVSFTVGNPTPQVTSMTPTFIQAGSNAFQLTITGKNFIPSSVVEWQSVTNGGAAVQLTPTGFSPITVTVPADLVASGQVVSVTVQNPSPASGTGISQSLTFIVSNPVPTITSISPGIVGAGSGDIAITVTGTNFSPGAEVSVNGILYTPTSTNSTTIVFTLPASAMAVGGFFPVAVVDAPPGGGTSASVNFEVDNPIPSITAMSATGASAGASALQVNLTGTGFVSTSLAEWNGVPLATTYSSSTSLIITIPAPDLATGTIGSITVVNPSPGGGTSNIEQFSVTNPLPSLSSVSPASVSTGAAAYTMTLNGTNFIPGSMAYWDGSELATTYVSSTQITAQVTASLINTAGSATVIVVNPPPSGGDSNSETVTIANGMPSVSSLSPSSALVGSATLTLTVNGASFTQGATVNWTNTAAGSTLQMLPTTYVSGSQLTATVDSSLLTAVGSATVSVTNPLGGGTSTVNATFTINSPSPTLLTISPTSIEANAVNTVLTLGGTNFVTSSVVMLNQSALATTYVSPLQLTAIIPASLVANSGSYTITVVNPAPGGGKSPGKTLLVTSVYTFPAGLQMISAPYDYSGSDFQTLLDLGPGTVAIWEPTLGEYALSPNYPADTMRLGQAYWADLSAPATLQIQGTPAPTTESFSIPLLPTWNQISDPFPSPVALSSLTVTPTDGTAMSWANATSSTNNIVSAILYQYDQSTNAYVPVYVGNPTNRTPELQPYQGYWIAANSSCTLGVPPPASGG